MSRVVFAVAVLVSFTASVRAAAPAVSHVAAIAGAHSQVIPCPKDECVVAHSAVRS